jgi:hypothetical protein
MIKRQLGIIIVTGILFTGAMEKAAGQEQYEGWLLATDGGKNITAMTFDSPVTPLGIEASFSFVIGNAGGPTSGTIRMRNGVERGMKEKEMDLDFAECGGPKAVWDYCKDHGKTVSYFPLNEKTFSSYGKVSRLITVGGQEFIGRLARPSDKPDGFSLVVEDNGGTPLQFYNGTVKEIQQMK